MSMTKKDKEMQALKLFCEKKTRLVNYLKGDHPMPTTRREFMASGILTMSASIAAPTLTQLISRSAWAQTGAIECPSGDGGGSAGGRPLFVHVQLSGGAALYAQSQFRGAIGVPLPNYNVMGVGAVPTPEMRFANQVPFVPASSFFTAMDTQLGGAAGTVYPNASFVHVAAASVDDSGNNAHDISGMLEAAGIIGEKLPTAITGNNNSRFQGAVFPAATLLRVQNAGSMEGALGVAGALGRFPGNAEQQNQIHVSLVQLIEDLNKSQVQQLAADPGSHTSQATFKQLIQCAAQKNVQNMASQENVDFLDGNVPQFADAAGFQAAFAGGGNDVTAAGQALGAGFAGLTNGVLINMGGYDYHLGGTRNAANADDQRAGDMVGRILRGAEAAGKPVFVFVSSDGSVSAPNDQGADNTVNWQGDAGRRGSAYMIAYNPTGAPVAQGFQSGNYADSAFQLNHFNGREVANVNPIAALDAQELMGSAVFLNYLAASGEHALIDQAALGPVKALLSGAVPAGAGSIFDYYTRFNRS